MNFRVHNLNQGVTVTQALIAVNVAVFAVMYLLNLNEYFINNFSSMGYIWKPALRDGYYYKTSETIFAVEHVHRLLTANYLHGGLMHIMFNMLALHSLGEIIENLIGKVKFFIVYTVSGIGGTILSSSMNIYLKPDSLNFSVGASGAVFGIAACLVVLAVYRRNRGMDFIYQINYQPLVMMLGLNLVMGQMVDRIDNWGHIGGLIAGALVGLVYIAQLEKRNIK